MTPCINMISGFEHQLKALQQQSSDDYKTTTTESPEQSIEESI